MALYVPERSILALYIILATVPSITWEIASGQKCGCAPSLCCSQYGYCGTTDAYCGKGCRSGPCHALVSDNIIKVSDVVTDTFFYGIANQAIESCPGRGFYNRAAFLQAANSYPNFGSSHSTDDLKREIAAFFAHVTYETDYMCYIEEDRNGISSNNYCDKASTQYPCATNQSYHGRGPLNLSWNFNYGEAGKVIGFDGLKNPEIVATDAIVSFKASLWFWMKNCHDAMTSRRDFGATIRAINGHQECDGASPSAVEARVQYFKDYCNELGVDPGTSLRC